MRRPGIFVLVALVVAALTFLVVDRDDPADVAVGPVDLTPVGPDDRAESPTKKAPPPEVITDPRPGFDAYQNRAGYAFEYPESWNLDERGTAVEIVSPDASVAMSFGVAPGGDVRTGMGELLDAIETRYQVDEVRGPNNSTVGDAEVVSVSGSGMNRERVPIEFTALVIQGPASNYAVTVFGGEDANESRIRAILDSFQTF